MVLVWSLLAFGGVYAWALAPIVAAAALLLVATGPAIGRTPDRAVDGSLIAILAVLVLQMLPLPRGIVGLLSPGTVRTWDALTLEPRSPLSFSVWPAATIEALAIVFAGAAVFWSARALFRCHGTRRAIRTIALAGTVASFAGLLQRKSGSMLVYGFWQPLETGAWPFGPFVNRNFFATWVLMAIPLCAGYLLARRPARRHPEIRRLRVRVAQALDGRTIWLITAVGVMTVALVASLSRSGIIGLAGVLIAGWAGIGLRRGPTRRGGAIASALVIALAVIVWGDLPAVVSRIEHTRVVEPHDRRSIWRDTIPLVRDHWLTGTGAGAYTHAMLLYQRTDRTYYDNQAHNQYLQVAADGGLLLAVPALLLVGAVGAAAVRQLRADGSAMFWIRLGAGAGLAGVLVQSFWETGLRAPANAVLAAVLAAMLLHDAGSGATRRP